MRLGNQTSIILISTNKPPSARRVYPTRTNDIDADLAVFQIDSPGTSVFRCIYEVPV
jgi:hypothetical protein